MANATQQVKANEGKRISGACRVCGCTQGTACMYIEPPSQVPMPCFWIDSAQTLCSNPRCVVQVPFDDLMGMLNDLNQSYGPGRLMQLRETILINSLDFLEMAKILGQFRDLAESIKKAKGGAR